MFDHPSAKGRGWDTDNPHTHIILRGRDGFGRDLVLPRDFVRHGFRGIARDVATERIGLRTPAQAREALDRETRRHAPTRLDRIIADQLPKDGVVKVADLRAPNAERETGALAEALQRGRSLPRGRCAFESVPVVVVRRMSRGFGAARLARGGEALGAIGHAFSSRRLSGRFV